MAIDKYLRIKQVCELTGLSRATIYAIEKKGEFPAKRALGARAVAWLESEVAAWMETKKTAVKSDREAKPGNPQGRKRKSPEKAEESAIEPAEQSDEMTPVGASVVAAKLADDFADWSEDVTEQTDEFADWSDVDDVPKSSDPTPRPKQNPNKLNAAKKGAIRINRGAKAINVVAEFSATRLSKSKPSK